MAETCENFEITMQRERCITEKCSCSQCDSLSCFEKRYPYKLCACGNCDKSETCSYYRNQSYSGTKLSHSGQYDAAYIKSANPVTDRNLDEFIEDDMIYESDRHTVLDANRPPPTSIHDYTKRLLTEKVSTKLKNKSISLNEYIDKISGKDRKNKQKYMVKLKETKPSAASLQQFETTPYSSGKQFETTAYSGGQSESIKMCNKHCNRKSKVENDRYYETYREIITEAYQPQSLSAYIDKISRNSHNKIKQIALDNYVNQLKHAKRSEPFENIINYPSGNYSEPENSHQKTKQNALDKYVNELKHAKRSEPFENTVHYFNGNYSASVLPKKRFNGNYSASESPKKRKRNNCGQCKKDICSHAQSAMVSCPLMSFSQSISKLSDPNLNTSDSCKANKNNNYLDIFKKLIEIYKICSCKVCECIGPKIIKNEICTCKPCDCAECLRYVGAINCPGLYNDQSKTHTPKKHADCRICDHPECPMYQDKETRKPPCDCADRQNVKMRKVPCESLQPDHSEHLRKYTSYTAQCCPTKDTGYCYTVNGKNNNGNNMIAMYTSVPPVYPNLYSYNRQSKTCDCKQCECIQCKEATASIIHSSNVESILNPLIDYRTNDVCSCKPCECQECTRFLTKYKFEQLHQAAIKPSNSSIYSLYDNASLYPYRCSLCRSEYHFDDEFVSVSPDIDSRSIRKGDVLTPAAHRAKVQKLMQEKRKLIRTSSGHQKESLPKVSNNNVKSLLEFHNYKYNYKDNSTITQVKKDISTALTKSFHRWAISQCDASVQSVESTTNKPALKNNSTNKTLESSTSIFSSTETVSKASLCKENDITVPPFTANSNKSSVSSCYSSGPNHCGYVVQFPKSAVASCIEGVLKSGLENDLQLFKFSFDPSKQTNILGTRKVYQGSDDENVIGASTSTSADAKYGQKNDMENDNNAININTNVAKSSDPYGFKNLKDNLQIKPIITSSESSNFINNVFKNKSHDECFHMIQSFNQINLAQYLNKYNRNEKIILKNDDEVSNLDDYYEKVRKTLRDSKNYTSHLQELLKMYEKENNEFVKISDRLKTTYEPVYNKFRHGNVFVLNRKMPTLQEIPTHIPDFDNNENILAEKVPTRDRNDHKPISHVLEQNNFSEFISKQESTNTEYGILEKNVENKMCEIRNGTLENEQSNEKPNNTLIEVITETASDGCNSELKYIVPNLYKKEDRTLDNGDNEGIERETKKIKKELDCPMCSANKRENVCLNPRFVAPKETMTSTSFQTNSSFKPKKKYSYKENKALKQLQNNVMKLVDMAILHSLNRIDDDSSALDSSSDISSISKLNLDSEFSNQFSQPNVQVNKEVWCDNLQLMKELKKQIKEHLQTACMHPLLKSHQSSLCMDNMSASSHSCCESKKVRFLMVQKISEHTALLKWSQPRELFNVEGYELLVDGRTVQKILNPSKCIAAVTCLPHSDKILLTIRTLTSAVTELGHYPASTIIYRPRVK